MCVPEARCKNIIHRFYAVNTQETHLEYVPHRAFLPWRPNDERRPGQLHVSLPTLALRL